MQFLNSGVMLLHSVLGVWEGQCVSRVLFPTGPALITLEAIEPKGIPGCCVDPFRVKLLTAL